MKVLLISPGYGRIKRGLESWISNIAENFSKMGVEVHIFSGLSDLKNSNNIVIHKFPILKREKLIYFKRPFEEISTITEGISLTITSFNKLLNNQFDFSIVSQASDGYALWIRKKIKKIGLLYSFHSTPKYTSIPFHLPAKLCDKSVAVSEYVKKEADKIFKIKSEVIYNGVDTDFFTPISKKDNEQIVFFAGALLRKKGLYTLINSVKGLNCKLLIAGNGPEYNHVKKIAEKENNIELLGSINKEKMRDMYRIADLTVVPSEYDEAVSLIPQESLSCGTPTIVSEAGGLKEITKRSGGGLLFQPGNTKELKEKIIYMLDNKRERKLMGIKGRKFVEKELDWKIIARKYIDILNQIK